MNTANLDVVREGGRIKRDKSFYRLSGETDPSEKGVSGKSDAKTYKGKVRMDPTRALEPSKKKITSIEAQRIMNVFVDTINRVKLVCIIPYITENLAQFESTFEPELFSLLQQHIMIQNCYLEIKQEMVQRHEHRQRKISERSQAGSEGVSPEQDVSADGRTQTQSSLRSTDDSCKEDTSTFKQESGISYETTSGMTSSTCETTPARSEPDKTVRSESQIEEGQRNDNGSERGDDSGGQICEEEEEEEYKAETEIMMRKLSVTAEQLSNSCKNILRAFTKYPSAVTAVHKEMDHMSEGATAFILNMEEMKGILRNRLLTSPIEEKEQAEYLREMIQKTQQNEIQIQKLEAELSEAIAIKEEETRRKNDIIRRLQEEIRSIDKQSEENIRRVKAEAEKNITAELKTSDSKCSKVQQELLLSKNSLQNLTNDHRNQEMELRRRNYKAETEVENWIQKYDQDMGQLQDEFETIDSIYKEEKKQLNELEEKFAVLQKEYFVIVDEREIARRSREESERKMVLMVRAATTIQAFWRSFKVRKILKAKKKKGGPGNGKKKKKK